MQFQRRKRTDIGIDMTPMIDCVFQLLIFFLLSSSFLAPTVKLELPQASANPDKPQATVLVTLDADQRLHINKQPVESAELRFALVAQFKELGRRDVILRADRHLEYETVLKTLVELRHAGAEQVHLAYDGEATAK